MTHVLLATGDLAPDRDHYDESYVETRDLLRSADVVFGQLETSFAASGTRLPQARHAVRARPEGAAALARAGFTVISMALESSHGSRPHTGCLAQGAVRFQCPHGVQALTLHFH